MANKPSLRDRKRAAAEQTLLDAAEQALADPAASMSSIAARAGVSVGTLYNYFDDTDDLVRVLREHRRKALTARVDAELDVLQGAPFEEQIRRLVTVVFSHFDEHRAYLRIVLNTTNETAADKRRSAMAALHDRLARVVKAGVVEGAVRADVEAIAVDVITGVLKAVLVSHVDGKGRFADLVDATVDVFLHGVGKP
jgi:AcrR family transcriptional regulator